MSYVYLLLLSLVPLVNSLSCPDVNCDLIKCPQGYNPFACPPNTYYEEKSALCGCCPGCVQPKGPGEQCSGDSTIDSEPFVLMNLYTKKRYLSTGQAPLVISENCAPGLSCERDTCQRKAEWNCPNKWGNPMANPTCDVDGSYAAVQCKDPDGEENPRCFCYSKTGKRIFGWDWMEKRANMQCLCSRMMDDISALKDTDAQYGDLAFHCSENGNFEPLQCFRGYCYCADPLSGQPVSSFVPASVWDTLSCYNKTTMGGQYLKLCDSQTNALGKLIKELAKHGSKPLTASTPPCDPDGSYAAKQCSTAGCFCKTKDNINNIGSYQPDITLSPSEVCKCARDKLTFSAAGKVHSYECNQDGNYQPFQKFGNVGFCVDSDGIKSSQDAQLINPATYCSTLQNCRSFVPGC